MPAIRVPVGRTPQPRAARAYRFALTLMRYRPLTERILQ
jgi:hypothetical protein